MAARSYFYTEALTEQTTTNGVQKTPTPDPPAVAATLSFTPEDNSKYLLIATYETGINSISADAVFTRLSKTAGSGAPYNAKGGLATYAKDVNDYYGAMAMTVEEYGTSPGEQTFQMQFYTALGQATARIRNIRIIALKLTTDDQFVQGTDQQDYSTNTSWVDRTGASITFTPGSQDDYIILAVGLLMGSSASYDSKERILVDAQEYGAVNKETYATGALDNYSHITKANLTAASHTIKLQIATESTLNQVSSSTFCLVLLKAGNFTAVQSDQDLGETSHSNGSYEDKSVVTFTPQAVDHLILASAIVGNDSTSEPAQFRVTEDGTSKIAHRQEAKDTTSRVSTSGMYKVTPTNASHTWKNQVSSVDAFSTNYIKESNLIVLQIGQTQATVQAKARVKYASVEKTVTAKARVKLAGNNKTVTAKARVKTIGTTKTVTAKAKVVFPISNLHDNFTDNSLDGAMWAGFGGLQETGGQIKFNLDASAPTQEVELLSQKWYDFTGGVLAFEVVQVPNSLDVSAKIEIQDGDYYYTFFYFSQGNLLIYHVKQDTTEEVVYNQAFNATNHKYLRFRESGGTIYWDASSDGTNWNNLASRTLPTFVHKANFRLYGYALDEFNGNTTSFIIDSVNVMPTTQTVTAKARVKYAAVTKTVTAKARVVLTVNRTVTARARLIGTFTKTIQAKADVRFLGRSQTVQAKARVVYLQTKTVTAKARILLVTSRTVDVKATVKQTFSKTIQAKGKVRNAVQRRVDAKATIENFSINIPTSYLIPSRKGRISFGFFPEARLMFEGYSGMVKVSRSQRKAQIHFEDELSYLNEFKLSTGSLEIDVRTDRYIWGILDQVYAGNFTVISDFDTDETWTGGTEDTSNFRGGDACRALQSTGTLATMSRSISPALDLTDYDDVFDYIGFFMNIDDITKVDTWEVKLGNSAMTSYYSYTQSTALLKQGWNQIWVNRGKFSPTGTPDWGTIEKVQIEVKAITANEVNFIFDELRIVDGFNYPRRIMDVGLQFIPTAWWAGNTSLYEIRTACEAEGARFFADNQGALNFWNRQHFNNNPELQSSKHEFNFDRMNDLEYPNDQTQIINKVVVKLNPRRVVASTEELWRNPTVPSIAGGATKEIWAEFLDPAPTTASGIVEPADTTDYTANTAADGSGTDKTAQIEILSFTRFTTAAKIEVKNNDAGAVYLTLLKVRGTPAKTVADQTSGARSSQITVRLEDATSIAKYGERPSGGLIIENKYLATEDDANAVAQDLIDKYKDPLQRVTLKARAIPQLSLGDMISVYNEDTGVIKFYRIQAMKMSMSIEGFAQEVSARGITNFETLTYFTIQDSSIEGIDVISP